MDNRDTRRLELLCRIVILIWPPIRKLLIFSAPDLVAKIDPLVEDLCDEGRVWNTDR